MSNINALREQLFKTLTAVREGNMEIDRAKAVVTVADAIIDSARVEVEFTRVTGQNSTSGFLTSGQVPEAETTGTPEAQAAIAEGTTVTNIPGGRIVTHRLKG